MSRIGLAAGLLALAVSGAFVRAQQPSPDQFEPVGAIQKVRDNLYMIPGQGGNTTVLVTRTGVVLVDTKLVNNGKAILERVASVSKRPVTTVINTHSHFDHVGSNEAFPATVDVVTQENTRAAMAKDPALKDKPSAMPDRTFRDRLIIGEGTERVELYFFGPAHTGGDAFVVFPAQRVMSAGDVYPWKAAPVIDDGNGGSPVALPDTLDQVIRTVKDVDMVIPGHMPVASWADFVEFGEFNRRLLTAARAGKAAGRTVDQTLSDLTLPARFAPYLANQPLKGLEFLGTARERARINIEMLYRSSK
jgi:glyoxylase-like metal-dependent hydrolase (beta-lactamase superfamily II)